MTIHEKPLSGIILDENMTLSLDELSGSCRVETGIVIAMVEEGIIEPLVGPSPEWRFAASQLPRVRKAVHLYHDLELNLAGVALAIELLDELGELRARLNQLESDV